MTNFTTQITTAISARTVKTPLTFAPASIAHLAHRHFDTSVDGDTLTVNMGPHSVSMRLTRTRTGKVYAHWQRVSKMLIELNALVADTSWFNDATNEWLGWDVMGLPHTSDFTPTQLRTQYRRLSRLYHPDTTGDNGELMQRFNLCRQLLELEFEFRGEPAEEATTVATPVLCLPAPVSVFDREEWNWMFELGDSEGGNIFICNDILGLPHNINEFTIRDVKKNYRRLSNLFHPDKGGCAECFDQLHWAYETLMGAFEA